MERFAHAAEDLLRKAVSQSYPEAGPDLSLDVETPPDPSMGDFAFPCFRLSKPLRQSPQTIAQKIAATIGAFANPLKLEVKATGPYVNFSVPNQQALSVLLQDILAGAGLGNYGRKNGETRGRWVLEYSSPNVAKPFQIYHLRPTALGAALARIGRYRGFDVVSINHLGDWGTQYGKLAVAMRLYADRLPPHPTIDDLVSIYVEFHKEAEKNPALEDEAREAFLKLEKGDPQMVALWKRCVDISLKEFMRIYDRLDVQFDHIWGESFYKDMLAPLLEDLRNKKLLIESEGAWVVPVTDPHGKELPPCILQKKDGATIYATRDVAAAIYRYKQFQFDRMSYIVGGEQKLHFQQVFAVLKKAGHEWVSRCEHIPTGIYRFKGGKMSTRKGAFVTLEEGLALAKERVLELLAERRARAHAEGLNDSGHAAKSASDDAIAEAVAIGAVTFFDLSTDPVRDVEFDLERVVDFDGETGPYLQYAHTRCLSILRKAAEAAQSGAIPFDPALLPLLEKPEEIRLVKTLGQLPIHLERVLQFSKASQLAHYLIDVTKAFNTFYRECHVLGPDPKLTRARLMLVESTRRVLARGLGLLGIPLPEKM